MVIHNNLIMNLSLVISITIFKVDAQITFRVGN